MVLHVLRTGLGVLGIPVDNVNALLRNAIAVHLLDLGADVRLVGALLGHRELKATSRFLRSAVARLKEVHRRFHPAEQSRKPRGATIAPRGTLEVGCGRDGRAVPSPGPGEQAPGGSPRRRCSSVRLLDALGQKW